MIAKILVFIALMSMAPTIKLEYLASATTLRLIHYDTKTPCGGSDGYYVIGEIGICEHRWDRDLLVYFRLLRHELQHYYQLSLLPWPNPNDLEAGDWSSFLEICTDSVSDDLVKTICAGVYANPHRILEVHAALPELLGDDMPPELQPWYPWLDLSPALPLDHHP